jgi:hypothetical protein
VVTSIVRTNIVVSYFDGTFQIDFDIGRWTMWMVGQLIKINDCGIPGVSLSLNSQQRVVAQPAA